MLPIYPILNRIALLYPRFVLSSKQERNQVQFVSSPIKSIDVDSDENIAHVHLGEEAEGQVRSCSIRTRFDDAARNKRR